MSKEETNVFVEKLRGHKTSKKNENENKKVKIRTKNSARQFSCTRFTSTMTVLWQLYLVSAQARAQPMLRAAWTKETPAFGHMTPPPQMEAESRGLMPAFDWSAPHVASAALALQKAYGL